MIRQLDWENFVELVKKRAARALKDIQLIGNPLESLDLLVYRRRRGPVKPPSDEASASRKKFEVAGKKQAKVTFELEE
jgi:hypothetical protein